MLSLGIDAASAQTLSWEALTEQALSKNPEILQARQALVAARADLERAGLKPNPTLTVSDTSWKLRQSPLGQGADLSVRVDQQIERGGKLKLRQDQAIALLSAAEFELSRARRQLLIRLAGAVIDVETTRYRLAAARDIAATLDTAESIARRRLAAGDLSEVATDRVTTDAIRARNDITTAQGDLLDAQFALQQIMSPAMLNEEQLRRIDAVSLPSQIFDLRGNEFSEAPVLTQAAANTPEVLAARQRERAALAASDLARAQRTRDVGVGLVMEKQPFTGGAYLGLSVSVPIHFFNDFSADIRRADSDLVSATLDTLRLETQFRFEQSRLQQSLTLMAEKEARLRDKALPVAEKNSKAVQFSFQRGAASVLEVLDAERTLRGVQIELINTRAERLKVASTVYLLQAANQP